MNVGDEILLASNKDGVLDGIEHNPRAFGMTNEKTLLATLTTVSCRLHSSIDNHVCLVASSSTKRIISMNTARGTANN